MMTTATMNRVELNNNELELVNGAGFWSWRNPNSPMNNENKPKEPRNYTLPKMDVDNRPAIDPPKYVSKSQHA